MTKSEFQNVGILAPKNFAPCLTDPTQICLFCNSRPNHSGKSFLRSIVVFVGFWNFVIIEELFLDLICFTVLYSEKSYCWTAHFLVKNLETVFVMNVEK